jgi:hypothetical protein
MDGVEELDLVGEVRDVALHPPLGLVERVRVDRDQLLQFRFLESILRNSFG